MCMEEHHTRPPSLVFAAGGSGPQYPATCPARVAPVKLATPFTQAPGSWGLPEGELSGHLSLQGLGVHRPGSGAGRVGDTAHWLWVGISVAPGLSIAGRAPLPLMPSVISREGLQGGQL